MNRYYLSFLFVAVALMAGTPARAVQSVTVTAIVSSQTNTCWDVQDYSVADGAIIQMYPCTGTSNQAWQVQAYGADTTGLTPSVRLVNQASGMCAALESLNPASGAIGLRQHICNVNDPTQQWQIDGDRSYVAQKSTGGIDFYFYIPPVDRRIINVGTHWCVAAQSDFSRPYQRGDCGNSNASDAKVRFKLSGL